MNMLIAIMGDTYARVQENSVAADARSVAAMAVECEEIFRMFTALFRRGVILHSAY